VRVLLGLLDGQHHLGDTLGQLRGQVGVLGEKENYGMRLNDYILYCIIHGKWLKSNFNEFFPQKITFQILMIEKLMP
jgi:hypothetical protein